MKLARDVHGHARPKVLDAFAETGALVARTFAPLWNCRSLELPVIIWKSAETVVGKENTT